MHSLRWASLAFIVVGFGGLVGCSKKVERYSVHVLGMDPYPDATIVVGNRTADAQGVVEVKPGELSDHEVVTLTYTTPCGKGTVTKSGGGAVSNGSVWVGLPGPKDIVMLAFDPALAGHQVDAPRITIPVAKGAEYKWSPVVFGDCPRVIRIDGREVQIPDGKADDDGKHYVVVAASPKTCLVSGVALYGTGGCKPESSQRLTGADAYALPSRPSITFTPIPAQAPTLRGCSNSAFLQVCE